MRGKLLFGAATAALLFAMPAAAQDVDQPGDASTQARLSAGATDGALSPAGDTDWYRLRVEEGQRYTIALDAVSESEVDAIDPVLTIYNDAGEQVAYNDDNNGTLNSQLSYNASAAGDVFVEARAFNEASTGSYRFTISAAAIPPDDAGDDASTRATATTGRDINGAIEYEGDSDWYRLSVRPGQRYRIALTTNPNAETPLGDPYLRLVDSEGTELNASDDSEGSLNSLLEYTPQSRGTVYVVASAYADAYQGGYTLRVNTERAPTDGTSADRNTRGRLNIGQPLNATLDFAGDSDWYRIRLTEGQSYRFRLNGGEGDSALGDPLLKLIGPDGVEIAMDDDGGGNLNSYLEYTAVTSGNYFVEARGFMDDASGSYVLTALEGDTPADATTDVTLSAEGDYREGVLAPAGDRDWYRLELTEGQSVRIGLTSSESGDALADPYLILYGADGAELARDDDSGDGLNAWLEYTAAASGPVFVEARGFSEDSAGRYIIAINAGEVGDNAEAAEYLAPNSEGRVSLIGQEGDVDWFAVDMIEGRPHRFYVDSSEPGPLADPLLTLLDENGQQIAQDDDGGAGLNSYLAFTSATGGRYYLAVSGYAGVTGRYFIRAVDTEVPGNINSDEYLDGAGDDRINRIEIPGDVDAYHVELEAGVRYTIDVRGHGDSPLGDAFLAVLDSNGERVASDDDAGAGMDARLRFTPQTSGSYILQASGLGGSIGGYQIQIAR
jgi:hypothetical protein